RSGLGGDLLPRLPVRGTAAEPAIRRRGADLRRDLRRVPLHRAAQPHRAASARGAGGDPRLGLRAHGVDLPDDRPPRPQQRARVRGADLVNGAQPAVRAVGLRKSYNGRVAVDGIDFEVEPGICFGFLGPNGAGKTTTMKMIYGLAEIQKGELWVLG